MATAQGGNTTPHFAACATAANVRAQPRCSNSIDLIDRLRRRVGRVSKRISLDHLLRPRSMSRLASASPRLQRRRPIRVSIHRSARKTTRYSSRGTDKRGKISHEQEKIKMQRGSRETCNLLLGAGKNNRNSLSR
ncbi:hypothetical protein M431DRAFT_446078 [Trichoderma harzianum CBS 226.95]|uniref:Uncharacterized protein n=1 Tax=Trichoderma harzianum CBS 226.95 TaxID=983964 RepID=A0A2T4A9Y2_TRIHA|nr:hypothetical protein M431DRAFT_446078 [Trichoderma harzianum CBS 226.95]PTB53900.1 hypothetical protein M431DRAFT_446078 [Trichoderma harzianum CBS 226.95]